MFRGGRLLAVVPARGGSIRLPGKNIALLHGVPLVTRALKHAFAVPAIDTVVLSSDSPEILKHAFPPAIELLQPAQISGPDAGATAAARFALEHHPADWLLLLQPTSPLRTPAIIVNCLQAANRYGARTVTPAGEPSGHVYLVRACLLSAAWSLNDHRLGTLTIAQERCIDIDTADDLEAARSAYEQS